VFHSAIAIAWYITELKFLQNVTMSSSTFYKRHCIYLPAMAGWFITSAALSSYNKVWYCIFIANRFTIVWLWYL